MTKEKARLRAKAKAGKKARKLEETPDQPSQAIRPGQFDPGASSIKSPRGHTSGMTFGGGKRGSARSR